MSGNVKNDTGHVIDMFYRLLGDSMSDIMSDEDGWGWDLDRTRYNKVRGSLLENNAELLRARIVAACKAISLNLKQNSDSLVDPQRIAAMVRL